jgi:hypothetical protein
MKRKSPPSDANYKMADGSAPENDHQHMSSKGGKVSGRAGSKNRQQRLKEEDQKVYEVRYFEGRSSQHLRDLGLGEVTEYQQAKRKAAEAFEMEVFTAVSEVPRITKKRKMRVAEKMSPKIPPASSSYRRGEFHIAYNKYEHLAA